MRQTSVRGTSVRGTSVRGTSVRGTGVRPAYYAATRGSDWWTLLHPPYTGWHLSYAVIGAMLAPHVFVSRLLGTVFAFFLAVGLAAHALDELHGRPLRTRIPARTLWAVTWGGLLGAVVLGVFGVVLVGWTLVPFMVLGPLLVVGYNAELFGGAIHTDVGFAASWGAFPVLVGYAGQGGPFSSVRVLGPLLAAGGALFLSLAQRALSTPARDLRRRVSAVSGEVTFASGRTEPVTAETLLRPLERALRAGSWAIMLLAAGLAIARLA